MSIDLLVPGMMVNARVKSILENGVMLSFLTYFTGTVSAPCNSISRGSYRIVVKTRDYIRKWVIKLLTSRGSPC